MDAGSVSGSLTRRSAADSDPFWPPALEPLDRNFYRELQLDSPLYELAAVLVNIILLCNPVAAV